MCIFNSFYLLHLYNPSFLMCLCFNMVSFRDQKKLGPRPDRSPLRAYLIIRNKRSMTLTRIVKIRVNLSRVNFVER